MTDFTTDMSATDTSVKKQNGLKPGAVAVIAIIVLGLGFWAGTQKDVIFAAIAPVFGIQASTDTIDTTSLQRTYQALKANFDGELNDDALIEGASRGLVEAAGDDYTLYMSAEESEEFDDSLSGSIGGGIGAEIGLRNEQVSIVRVLTGTPAAESDLQNGDYIMRINDEETTGWTVDEAVAKIRGEIGTTVKLTVLRGEEEKIVTITRASITSPSVEYEINDDNIGVITMSRFDQNTGRLAREAAQTFIREDVDGVILDLRRNGGGYVTSAQDVAGLWLDNKVVVTERSGDRVVDELKSGVNPLLADIPTVVLVDEYSASASEIVAGALKEYGAAKLVGVQTFGKGSVQQLVPLPFGAQLKVTIARWYTPKGQNISQKGIEPDVKKEMTIDDMNAGRDPQLNEAIRQLKP